ncbi:MAG TPA: hypothetical protein VN778_05295, partial [Verrucomicrobiae bacterium]|nr:hypothetical protein [Verrucomicrobiae bacterium]
MSAILLPSKLRQSPQYPARLKVLDFWRLVDIQGLPLLGAAASSTTRTLNGTAQLGTGLAGKCLNFVVDGDWLNYGENQSLQLSTMTGLVVVEMTAAASHSALFNTNVNGSFAGGFVIRTNPTGTVTALKQDTVEIGTTVKTVRKGSGVSNIAWSYNNVTGKLRIAVDGVLESFTSAQTFNQGPVGRNSYYGDATQAGAHKEYLFALSASDKVSDSELAEWSLNPWSIFKTPTRKIWGTFTNRVLTGENLTQNNSTSDSTIGIGGALFAFPITQSNALSSDQIVRDQYLDVSGLTQSNSASTAPIGPYGRLRSLLRNMPLHTWAQVNTTKYIDCQMPLADRPGGFTNPVDHVKVIIPWSSFAFDHVRGNLILWGGGHANYSGNQIYHW